MLKVVGANLASYFWEQITQIYSHLPRTDCHRLKELMLYFQKHAVRGDNFYTSGDKSHLNRRLQNKIFFFCGSTFKVW